MDNIHKLKTEKQEINKEVIELLTQSLKEAENGEISEILIIKKSINGEWLDKHSGTLSISEWIGKLEIAKYRWIGKFLNG